MITTHKHFRADIIMGGGALPPVPDWKSYKVGSHTPELEQVQKMLKSMGLKVGQEDFHVLFWTQNTGSIIAVKW